MSTYTFSTISSAEALAFTGADTLKIDQGSGWASTVIYTPASGGSPDTITLTLGARSVVFGTGLATGAKTFADGSSLYIGGAGNDQATLGATNDGLFGGVGADTLSSGDGVNVIQGNQGADSLTGGAGADTIYGGQDNDTIALGAGGNFGQGNKGNDTIAGSSSGADTMLGGQDNDMIGATSVSINYTTGVVTAQGLSGGGRDILNGNLGNDTIIGGAGDDQIFGEEGDDVIIDTTQFIAGTGGRNTIDAGAGNDTVFGTSNDSLLLGDGDDLGGLATGAASDGGTVDGGAGNDALNGGNGRDQILGGTGADTIDGFGGADTITGGAGADVFQFYSVETTTVLADIDVITDWASSEDKFYFANGNDDVAVGVGSAGNYAESTAADYTAALTFANSQVAGGAINYVAVQVGSNVYVFADTLNNNGSADSAVMLSGKSLADVDSSNFA